MEVSLTCLSFPSSNIRAIYNRAYFKLINYIAFYNYICIKTM